MIVWRCSQYSLDVGNCTTNDLISLRKVYKGAKREKEHTDYKKALRKQNEFIKHIYWQADTKKFRGFVVSR